MNGVDRVLVVGGGIVGNATAILLARLGIDVHLVEATPDWSTTGSGITLHGNALRVLLELGVWDDLAREMFVSHTEPVPALGGPDLPNGAGIYRPHLQAVLAAEVRAAGVTVSLGVTVTGIGQRGDCITVALSNGGHARYDLVVAADGIRSATRRMIGIDTRPAYTGFEIWRVHAKRPVSVLTAARVNSTPARIAGYQPVSDTHLYAFLVTDATLLNGLAPGDPLATVLALSEGLPEPWPEIRADFTEKSRIDHRRFEHLLVDRPWHRGRVLLVGDAAHACPPTLAQGAAMGLEDAYDLAGLLASRDRLDEEFFAEFMDLRYERTKLVVEASVAVCRALADPGAGVHPGQLVHATLLKLPRQWGNRPIGSVVP